MNIIDRLKIYLGILQPVSVGPSCKKKKTKRTINHSNRPHIMKKVGGGGRWSYSSSSSSNHKPHVCPDPEKVAQEKLGELSQMDPGQLAAEMVSPYSYRRDLAVAVYNAKFKSDAVDKSLTEAIVPLMEEKNLLKHRLDRIPLWIQWFFGARVEKIEYSRRSEFRGKR